MVKKFMKWSTYVSMTLLFLAGGIEYSVILPTMWDYMQSMDGSYSLYGVAVASFSISNFLSAPVYGVLFDKTHKTKYIVLIANIFEIGGNFTYFVARTKYMIIAGRFLAGLGAGVGAGIYGEIARTTSKKDRTLMFSFFMGIRQFGLVIGPALNLVLELCNFSMGFLTVNKLTSPGGFMVIVWVLVEVMFLFFFFTLPTVVESPGDNGDSQVVKTSWSINQPHTNSSEDDEYVPLLTSPTARKKSVFKTILWGCLELIKEETVVLLTGLFVVLVNQSALETMFPPFDEHLLLKWSEKYVSISFSVAGAVIIVSFVIVTGLSRLIGDRYQILIGILIEAFSYIWLLILVGPATPSTSWIAERLMVGFYLGIFGLPFFTVPSVSLYSKVLPTKLQGFGQGVRRSVLSLAAIVGPLWAGGAITLSHYYTLFAIPCALVLMVLIMTLLSFSRLKG